MATHSSILACKISRAEEPGGLQSMGSQRVDTTEATEHACTSLKTLSPSTVTWGIRVSAHTFGGTQTFSPSHLVVPETDQQSASTCALTSSDRK